MPGSLAEMLRGGVEAGLKDQSFEGGYAAGSKERQMKLEKDLAKQQQQESLEQAMNIVKQQQGKGRKVGVSLSPTGGVAIQEAEQDPMSKMMGLVGTQSKNLQGIAAKKLGPHEQTLSQLENAHDLLDQRNAVADKQVAANLARLTEGPGQRLLQSVIQSLSAGKSLPGSMQDKTNWLLGTAESGFTEDQRNKIRENLFSHQNLTEKEHSSALGGLKKQAGSIAPALQATGGLDSFVDSLGAPAQSTLQRLKDRQNAYKTQAGAATTLGQPMPSQYQEGKVSQLKRYLFGGVPPGTQQKAPGQSKPPTVTQGGHTYNLNPITGEYE